MLKYLIVLLFTALLCSCSGGGQIKECTFTVINKMTYKVAGDADPFTSDVQTVYKLQIVIVNSKDEEEIHFISCNEDTYNSVVNSGKYIGIFQSYWRTVDDFGHYSTIWSIRLLEFKGKA